MSLAEVGFNEVSAFGSVDDRKGRLDHLAPSQCSAPLRMRVVRKLVFKFSKAKLVERALLRNIIM